MVVVLILASWSTVIPISGGYFCGMWLFWWLTLTKRWGDLKTNRELAPVHWGVLAMILAQLVSGLVACFSSPYSEGVLRALRVSSHMTTKLAVLWFVYAGASYAARASRWPLIEKVAPWFLLGLGINLVYCVAQRYTGIDWTHGFGARLGEHRFAYGVYRVSGFTGHPLTLSYNLMMIVVAGAWVLLRQRAQLPARTVRYWAGIVAVALFTLVITGSRYPLAALAMTLAVCEARALWRWKTWILAGGALLLGALWLEGSTFGRMTELFNENQPLVERFPRLLFWQVHLRMFLDHPFAGVSLAGVDRAYQAYYAPFGPSVKMMTAHNIFLQVAADSGLIGLLGLLALLGGFYAAARRADHLRYFLAAAIFSGLLQNNFRDSEFLFAFWFLAAVLAARLEPLEHSEREPSQNLQSAAGHADSAAHLPG